MPSTNGLEQDECRVGGEDDEEMNQRYLCRSDFVDVRVHLGNTASEFEPKKRSVTRYWWAVAAIIHKLSQWLQPRLAMIIDLDDPDS